MCTRSIDVGAVGRRARLAMLLAGVTLGTVACDRLLGQEDPEKPQWTVKRKHAQDTVEASSGGEPEDGTTAPPSAAPRQPIERAEKKLYFPAKGSTNLGFNLEALSELRALAGEIEVPAWSAASDDDPAVVRDDDISTAWRCTPTETTACALGLVLPRPARVKALRLYAAGLPTSAEARAQRRPTKVRVHTDEGFVDVPLPDDELTHLYIVLGQHVRTRSVAIEVLETRGKKGPLTLAELEVYGDDGVAREPWSIDPARTFVRLEADPWKKVSGAWALRSSVLELVDADGRARPLMAGTALVGKVSDRMLLLERIERTSCSRHEGTFFLVDRHTRVVAPLGSLGGTGADVYRHAEGLGFAVGRHTPAETVLHGVMLESGEYQRKRTAARLDKRAPDTLKSWNLDAEPLRRGGANPSALPQGCVLGSDDLMAELSTALGRRGFEPKPGQWVVCDLGDGVRAWVTARAPCGKRYELHVLDGANEPVASREGSGRGTHLRLERPAPDLVLAEIGQANGRSEVFRVTGRAIEGLGKGTALALRPPPACRESCDDPLPNPHDGTP